MSPVHYRVAWTMAAVNDVYAIIDFIKEDDPINAARVLERITAKAQSLEFTPARGRIVPEVQVHGGVELRELILDVWRIIYSVTGEVVHILAVADSRRDLEDFIMLRLLRPEQGQ